MILILSFGRVIVFQFLSFFLRRSRMDALPDTKMSDVITAIMASLGTVATGLVHVHLYTNNVTPTKSTLLADLTELTNVQVPGYSPKSANWFAGVPHRNANGSWEIPNSLADPAFIATGLPPIPIVVYGYFFTDSTDAILLGSGKFTSPFTFALTGDGFDLPTNPMLLQTDGLSLSVTLPNPQPA
jgi:hypothetical protein